MKDSSIVVWIKFWMAVVAFIASIIIGFIALYLPPEGVIDSSVLWFTAQLLVFVSGILGFNLRYDVVNMLAEHKEKKQKEQENDEQ